jgi:tetratricopeptide (TPR) repeat protein
VAKKLDPSMWDSFHQLRDWAHAKAHPFLKGLPNDIEPYAADLLALLILISAGIGFYKKGKEIWGLVIWLPTRIWRKATGRAAPVPATKETLDETRRTREASEKTQTDIEVIKDILLAQSGTDSSPVPEDALERALAASREVLASNDPAKDEAQQRLRAGDLPGAEAALADAYEREATAALQMEDQTNLHKLKAAQTAREKAAFAATRSVGEALEWYEKAAANDPGHFWTQIELCRLYQLAGRLTAAHDAAIKAAPLATDDREQSIAYDERADVLVAQGDLGKAIDAYNASMAIRERLADADPTNTGLQRDLSVSHNKIGDVLRAQGDLAKAIDAYNASMAIRERLADADPTNTGLQRDLSVSFEKIGDVLVAQGDLGKAIDAYNASHKIFEGLADADPTNTGLQRDLSVSFEKIGDAEENRGDVPAAITAYERSLPVAASLAERFPDHPQFVSDLAITERRLDALRAARGG